MKNMKTLRPDDEVALGKILERQKRLSFDIEKAVHWDRGIDLSRYFVPLDGENLVFPGASPEQRKVLSQFLGLFIAQTFGEMETGLVQAKEQVWKKNLERFPVNPEFEAFGEQFFTEEEKHSRMFRRYLDVFASQTGVSPVELRTILPTVSDTTVYKVLKLNSAVGGHALWWVLTLVEEISILIYKQIQPFKKDLDPLYYEIHRRHFEEEVRHSPYSYWMLEHLYKRDKTLSGVVFQKTDVMLAQAMEVTWALASFARLGNVRKLKAKHPFYATLYSCLPLLVSISPIEVVRRLFVTAPFVSLLLNPNYHGDYQTLVAKLRALEMPIPKPQQQALSVE